MDVTKWLVEQDADLACLMEDYLKSSAYTEDKETVEMPILAAIETSLDPDSFAYIRLLFPDATGVQVLPSYDVQDYDEAVEIVKAVYPTTQIVTPHELNQEVERRQPNIVVPEECFEVEF